MKINYISLEDLRASSADLLVPLVAGDLINSQLVALVNQPTPPPLDARPHPPTSSSPISWCCRSSDFICDEDVY